MNAQNRQERSRIAAMLESLRKKKRFSKQALADASGVSATYIGLIESGFDPNSGRQVTPSAKVIRALSKALADGDDKEESRIHEEMMAAVGYIESLPSTVLAGPAAPLTVEKPRPSNHDVVTLRDPRLWTHVRDVLENWEKLSADDQSAVLSFLKLVHEKHSLQNGRRR